MNKALRAYLIVESANDEAIFTAILEHLGIQDQVDVVHGGVSITWVHQSAEDKDVPKGLTKVFLSLLSEIALEKYDHVGIIWDADTVGVPERLGQINAALSESKQRFSEERPYSQIVIQGKIQDQNDFIAVSVEGGTVQLGCHIVNLDGKGEIENLLKAIANQDSSLADCINSKLPECFNEQGEKPLRDKDLVKLWINHYQRYDTLKKRERNEGNTTTEGMMKRNIFDLGQSSPKEFVELKEFLMMLVTDEP